MTVRTRARGGFSTQVPINTSAFPVSCSNGSWYDYTGGFVPMRVGKLEFMTDVVVPGFAKRRAKGELFFNNMSYQSMECRGSGAGAEIRQNTSSCGNSYFNTYRATGNASSMYIPKSSWGGYDNLPALQTIVSPETIRDLKSEMSTKLMAQRGHSDNNLFESVAEADQTIGLFERPLQRLTQTFNKAAEAKRKGRFTGYTVDGISHLWLMYRYGISPALNDIEGIISGLQKKTEKRRETLRAKGGFEVSNRTVVSSSNGFGTMSVSCDIEEGITCRAFSLDEYSTSLWENIGFSNKGLSTLPWELLRFSFVYDWFLNIGDFINAQVPASGWNQLGSGVVLIRGVTNRYTVYGGTPPSGYTFTQSPHGTAEVNFLQKTREPLSFPDIVIRADFRFDRFKRVADAFALLAQQGNSIFGKPLGRRIV